MGAWQASRWAGNNLHRKLAERPHLRYIGSESGKHPYQTSYLSIESKLRQCSQFSEPTPALFLSMGWWNLKSSSMTSSHSSIGWYSAQLGNYLSAIVVCLAWFWFAHSLRASSRSLWSPSPWTFSKCFHALQSFSPFLIESHEMT